MILLNALFRHELYCPECHKVQLYFYSQTSQRGAHLATARNQQHDPSCSYGFDPIRRDECNKYYQSLNDQQIQDKLQSCENWYFNKTKTKNSSDPANDNPFIATIPDKDKKRYVHKQLPRRSLSTINEIVPEELHNIPILFYGKVKLKTEHFTARKTGIGYYHLLLRNYKAGATFKHLFIGINNVTVDEEKVYFIAFIGIYGLDRFHNDYEAKLYRYCFRIKEIN